MAKIEHCTGDIVAEKDGRQIIDCQKCGYIHVHPMYNERELEEYYENFYPESTPSHLWAEKVRNIKRWKREGSILDVGCWEGTQLEYFKKEGWYCVGVELNKRAARIAESKGFEVLQMSIEEFFSLATGMKWDVINAAFLLEHIPAPADFLTKIQSYLKPEGIVVVEVPNDFSLFQLAYLKNQSMPPYWLTLPDHLNYFNKSALEPLMERTGWTIIHGESSYPMEMFLLMGDDYLGDDFIGALCFNKVLRMENILRAYDSGLVSQIYSALYTCGIGRSNIIYAKRK